MTWDVIAPGTWLIFGIIGLPVYAVLVGWAVGKPSDARRTALGLAYLVGLTVALWGVLFLKTVVLDVLFY